MEKDQAVLGSKRVIDYGEMDSLIQPCRLTGRSLSLPNLTRLFGTQKYEYLVGLACDQRTAEGFHICLYFFDFENEMIMLPETPTRLPAWPHLAASQLANAYRDDQSRTP